ncbi:nuclear pore complex protein Nup107 [Stomoxys calcitrans]|uniref:nuclear pore complex protein Nup107 n=1 Tax=Stomoxys calcitrans TaxID=35570 RepID=UPI0027E2EE46|nr:nuclear pore complex protein Nup107 [Stomoxys calcitrans]
MSGTGTFVPKRGLINTRTPQRGIDHGDITDSHNFSISLLPGELQRMLDNSQLNASGLLSSSFHGGAIADTASICERSLIDHPQMDGFKEKANMLFPQFLEILQARTNDSEVFDTIQDLIHTCSAVLDDCLKDVHKRTDNIKNSKAEWLDLECKTWKLLYALYKDRILLQSNDPGMDCDIPSLGGSEKEIIAQLYNCNSTLREYQLIIDWLEACYEKKMTGPQVGHTTDRTVAWENTLFQLKKQQQIAFGSGAEIVKSLDPDAPNREKKPLHALDEEDNMRLSRCIFEEIRQGRIDEAMSLCKYCGQTWRAAILEGWRLHEDPNYENYGNAREKQPIEGNPRRDIWKKCAWMMANSKKFDEYTRAIAGAFCGHLESLKALFSNSWEDLLWAYLKVQVDIRVESEIRANCMKTYHAMPEEYWNSKMSLEQIFDELLVHNDAALRDFAQSKIGIIQKFLILDNIPELLQQIRRWIEDDKLLDNKDSVVSSHMLRFLTHIVLFMRQIGRVDKEEIADRIIAAYVESLIPMKDAQLVAFYTAALPGKTQVTLYSKFLETIKETNCRQSALEEAMGAGLDIENITRYTVETIRQKEPTDMDLQQMQDEPLQHGDISKFDEYKIKSLEWLTFLPSQRGELLWQGNAMIRCFLAENKLECVRAVYDIIPQDSLSHIVNIYGSKDNFPCREDCSIKEYLGYKVYLAAIDSFNEWSRLYHNRPKEPQLVNAGANFTERMASEHKEQVYRAELNRWNVSLEEQAKLCRDSLFNVLLFPEKGWLIDPDTPKDPADISPLIWENRQIQLDKIRSICIPEITLLLHKVLHLSEDYQGCVKLADEIASENRELYKVYTKHKLAELLSKLAESSLELLNKKLDPWGFPVTV